MPEGHTIHRLARDHRPLLVGQAVSASSPQGRFATGAELLTGRLLQRIEPYGKHLFYGFEGDALLHVHLGLYGKFVVGHGPAPEPRGALRLRMVAGDTWIDLRGPTACEVVTPHERDAVFARLGPDPLRKDADPEQAWERLSKSRRTVGELLMDQTVLAGIGNVYRAEVLYRAGLSPFRPGREVPRRLWDLMWPDLRGLLQAGVRAGRIVTTEREDRARRSGTARREDAHYVYRRHGLPCRRCGAEVLTLVMVGRNLFWCPVCQPAAEGDRPLRRYGAAEMTVRPGASAVGRRLSALLARVRREPPPQHVSLAGLALLSVLITVGSLTLGAAAVPAGTNVLPLLGGSLFLDRAHMRRLLLVVAASTGVLLVVQGLMEVRPGAVGVVVVTAVLSYELARSREETGLLGLRGDSVLTELRRRLSQQGEVPPLPPGWRAEARVSPAGGGPFSGDFVVSAVVGQRLELALVDVSGKGVAAGTRSLLLSGAMGGLLGARAPRDLLPAANAYLHRQAWDEGFATAAHLVVDLATGAFLLESAGHPPMAHFDAGSGRWSLVEAGGPALGLLPDVAYAPVAGTLDRGDALLLYTDGLVEVPGRDLDIGIDKLLGEAERLVPHGFAGGCDVLLRRVAAGEGDDRGVVIVWREG